MVLWQRPNVLSEDEALTWARREMERLVDGDGIDSACLHRIGPGSHQEPPSFDWLLELELRSADVGDQRRLAELVRDLRMLGMRPVVVAPAKLAARVSR
jgi:hypothetical protein